MRRLLFLLFILAALPLAVRADDTAAIQAKVVFDQPAYFLGENIIANFALTNSGNTPVTIDVGGDYAGAPRALRFKVSATDEQGGSVPDPYLSVSGLGGLGTSPTIAPGATYWLWVPLTHYLDFEHPGTYTIRVSHDLGWEHPATAEGTLTLKMPTTEEAQAVVEHMLQLPRDTGGTWGKRRELYADLSALHYPVYLPALEKLARAGNTEAVEGIAGTMTPEAVHLLFTLAPAMPAARGALRWRTPDPQKRGFWQQWAQRRVAQGAWDERLRPEGMALGWLLLAKSSAEEVTDGAHLISCLGSKDDLPRLLTEFDRILVEKRNDPVEQHAYPSPITASGGVLHAVQALYTREAPLPAAPKTAAERLYILWAVKKYADVRPQGWQAVAQELLKDPIPFVRSTALQGLPEPLDPEFIPPVARLMADSSDRVAGAATGVAMRSKRPEFGEPALNLLRKTKSTWLVGNAVAVARECGVTRDRWMAICIARLEEPGMTAVMYEQLLSVITEHGRSQSGDITPASAARLKVRWQAFLDANRTALRAGTRFTPGEPPVTADLLDPGTTLMRDDGKDWPAR